MNLILCEADEVGEDGGVTLAGVRAAHVRQVLRAAVGDDVRVGIVDGPCGHGAVTRIDAEDEGGREPRVELKCRFDADVPPRPAVDLLLALPRPKVLRRLWAQLAAIGVGRIILTNAFRVERNYFDTHFLDESIYRPLLIEGLQQARDTRLPRVSIHRQFRKLVEDELDTFYEAASNSGIAAAAAAEASFANVIRLVAHPAAGAGASAARSIGSIGMRREPTPRVLLAIGPEGGWNAFELDLLQRHRFEPIAMGPRILRTDTACIALLALVHDALRQAEADRAAKV
jgi:RsmE family RNA methyltransferase